MKAVLATLIEGVTMLFAAFGGFLTVVAPPPGSNDTLSAVGLASFAAVIAFAIAKLYLKQLPARAMRWLTITLATLSGIAFVALGMLYLGDMDRYTFRYPENEQNGKIMLVSETLTARGQKLVETFPELKGANAALLSKAGGIDRAHEIWPPNAVVEKRTALVRLYTLMVLALSLTLGFAIEGLSIATGRAEEGG